MTVFKKVTKGQKKGRGFPADVFNGLVDILNERPSGFGDVSSVFPTTENNVVNVENSTEEAFPLFGVISLDGPLFEFEGEITLDQQISSVLNHGLCFRGTRPKEGKPTAICLSPIQPGQIGRAAVSGPVPCIVDVSAESHEYARPTEDETEHLVSTNSGDFRILAKPDGTGKMVAAVTRGAISPFVGHANGDIKSGLDPATEEHGGEVILLGETEPVRAFADMLDGSDTISDGKRVGGLCINGIYRIFNADCESGEED